MKLSSTLLSVLALLLVSACTTSLQAGDRPVETDESHPLLTFQLETVAPKPTETREAIIQPVATASPAAIDDEQAFDQGLADAIVSQNLPGMRQRMGEQFILAYWRSEGHELNPDEAIAELKQNYFTSGADPVTDFSIDVSGLLDGSNPLSFFGPDAVRAFHITGLGSGADQQGIAAIARNTLTGRRYWCGLLLILAGQPGQPQLEELNAFAEQLARSLEGPNFDALRSMMPERFAVATWNTQLLEYTSEEALQRLRQGILAPRSSPAVIFGADVPALLEGADPLALWGPASNTVRALHVMGLGQDANQEAVIVIGWNEASRKYYWHGILLPPDGYFHTNTTPEPRAVIPTEVQYVIALDDVNQRSGPGLNYAIEGVVAEGQIAQVNGRSADGQWWQIVCPQDASGSCWISADSQWTRPAAAP
jgi:hypothetical protein